MGHLPPKTSKLTWSNRYLTQTSVQPIAEIYCSLHIVVIVSQLFYDVRFWSMTHQKFHNFCIFPIQMPKKFIHLLVSLEPRGCRMLPVISCCSGRSKRVSFPSGSFMRRLMGKLGHPKLPKCSPMGNACIYKQRYYMACPIWTNESSKRIIPHKDEHFGVRAMYPHI